MHLHTVVVVCNTDLLFSLAAPGQIEAEAHNNNTLEDVQVDMDEDYQEIEVCVERCIVSRALLIVLCRRCKVLGSTWPTSTS